MKPQIGSEVNLVSSYLPVQWNDVKFIWNNSYLYCSCRWKWKWRVIIAVIINVWLHSSVGRASHRYRGGHGFESRWSPDFFRLLLSNCLNWKIYCDDHSSLSLSSTTAVQIWIISYKLHNKIFASLTDPPTDETNRLSDWPTVWLSDYLTDWLILVRLTDWLTDLPADSLTNGLTDRLIV